jgi:hypothetical protein
MFNVERFLFPPCLLGDIGCVNNKKRNCIYGTDGTDLRLVCDDNVVIHIAFEIKVFFSTLNGNNSVHLNSSSTCYRDSAVGRFII